MIPTGYCTVSRLTASSQRYLGHEMTLTGSSFPHDRITVRGSDPQVDVLRTKISCGIGSDCPISD